jgi:hypothetical protein
MASQGTIKVRTTYEASCHCGLVRYGVSLPEPLEDILVMQDNCSICTHNGYLMVFSKQDEIVFHTGYDKLANYQFGNKLRTHFFCPTCGSSLMVDLGETRRSADLKPLWAINVRLGQQKLQRTLAN